jgi:hypothetical protein
VLLLGRVLITLIRARCRSTICELLIAPEFLLNAIDHKRPP